MYFFSVLSVLPLASARVMWSSQPATFAPQSSSSTLLKTSYPVGNGKLAGLPYGPPGAEKISLNVDSLWSGGPFEVNNYAASNPTKSVSSAVSGIQDYIWQHGTGNVSALFGSTNNYGNYYVLGNVSISMNHGSSYTNYNRTLDLTSGFHGTQYKVGSTSFQTSIFCSQPAQVCVWHAMSSQKLPQISVTFDSQQSKLANASCSNGFARLTGLTQTGPPTGMKYDAVAHASKDAAVSCSGNTLLVQAPSSSITVVISAGTNYNQKAGNAANNWNFKGTDPAATVEKTSTNAINAGISALSDGHAADYSALFGAFTLSLPDVNGTTGVETSKAISSYSANGGGDPFVEALLFDYSRYLLICSSRENSLPASLQGKWAENLNPSWHSDYHLDINLQMNYWAAAQTGLSKIQSGLWDFIEDTWVARGQVSAQLMYNAPGWIAHTGMNVFGSTGMGGSTAYWADFPVAAAWVMQHVWDNYEYTQDVNWLKAQGYPLMKGVAQFWQAEIVDDKFSKDGSLVASPCTSPEHGPTTFGCAFFQQLIQQIFEAVLTSAPLVNETDSAFISDVTAKVTKLDKGVHFTTWGGIKEWKLPDSYGYDTKNTHRHLSHLVGWFPGYSISSFEGGYTNATIQKAVAATLTARGSGYADANAGWEKAWRSACWARLNNTAQAYYELKYTIDQNIANNGLSMYSGQSMPFQIDANFGLAGAILSMLIVDLPVAHNHQSNIRTVVLGPAIPPIWGNGSVKGLRLRGGKSVSFSWDAKGKVQSATLSGSGQNVKLVNVDGKAL